MESSCGQMVEDTKGNMLTIRSMVAVLMCGQTVKYIRVNGAKVRNTDKVN